MLYRQAEIRRTQLGDEAGALDAYLRSSDADPRFVPSRLRLIDHFWDEGDLDVVADLAGDLPASHSRRRPTPISMARLGIALAGPRSEVPPRFSLATHPGLAAAAVRVLSLAGDRAAARGVDSIDPMMTHARFWAGADGERGLVALLIDMVLADPARPGPALVLGGLAARTRRLALARAAYSLPAFVQPEGLGTKLLDALPMSDAVPPGGGPPGHAGRPSGRRRSRAARALAPGAGAARPRLRPARAQAGRGQRPAARARHRAAPDRRSPGRAGVRRRAGRGGSAPHTVAPG